MALYKTLIVFKKFFSSSLSGGVLLLLSVVLSLIIANTCLADNFIKILETPVGFENKILSLRYSLSFWINDGLMSVFFLLVGLEIKREIVRGELSSVQNAILPILAAIGGVIVPALLYTCFNNGIPLTKSGWGIPIATDIAFALAILSVLGNKLPGGLKIFLTALAIADDLIAIIVIALFYSGEIHFNYLMYAGGVVCLLIVFNRLGIKNLWYYMVPGAIMWYFVHHSGIHATIAGVLTALTLPTTPDAYRSPLEKLEYFLSKPINFIVMPLFALANTTITISPEVMDGLLSPMGIGIVSGLFLGKPLGIFTMSWLSVKLKIARLPKNVNWYHILGLGILGGIGFTMSIFIATLSLRNQHLRAEAKLAILLSSALSCIAGYTLLSLCSKKKKAGSDYNTKS